MTKQNIQCNESIPKSELGLFKRKNMVPIGVLHFRHSKFQSELRMPVSYAGKFSRFIQFILTHKGVFP